MQMNYHDAMAIVRRYGRPDYFITFTANPTWPEIAENLSPGDHAANRPDLAARVFHLKLRSLLDDLTKHEVLGKVIGYTWTIEFQKRGLPHAHILLIMAAPHKPKTQADVDKVVCAEIPNRDDPLQKDLYSTVVTSLMHGPCGAFDPTMPCCGDTGVCSKGFPFAFQETTEVADERYPVRFFTRIDHYPADVTPHTSFVLKKYRKIT